MFVDFFIRRPIFASVCSLLIILAGAVSIPILPIAQYPELAPPQVNVSAVYTGANAQVVESAVTIPLEQAINGVEGMKYMTSSSGNDGTSQITVTFDVGRDLDLAAVDVQNRISRVEGQLPQTVRDNGIQVNKASTAFVLAVGLYAENGEYSNLFLSNYADVYMVDALKRVEGVGEVRIFGERKYAMRIWLDPQRLAARNLTAPDVVGALREQNVLVPAGQVGQAPAVPGQQYQITVRAQGRLTDPEEFGRIVLKTGDDGTLVQLKDVGRVELGAENYNSVLRFNGYEGVGLGVIQLATANALEVERNVRAELERLAQSFPPGMQYAIAFNTTTVIAESIREVVTTLFEAIALVILVIFVFLQTWRATVIPAITIPVSLVGTFAFVKLFGFSINTLTLFGLTLATGLVVDDAIVVIENIERHIHDKRESPRVASSRAMGEVTGAVIAMSLVVIAVFVPVAFFPGTAGRLYNQFALTIAFSIALSTFNALTLTPALSALLLAPGGAKTRGVFGWVNRVIAASTDGYVRSLRRLLRLRLAMLGAFAVLLLLTWWVYRLVPTSFVPEDDQGYFITQVQAPAGTSLQYTTDVAKKVEAILGEEDEVQATFAAIGFSFGGSAPNKALVFSPLRPMDERTEPDEKAAAVINRVRGRMLALPDAIVVPFGPPAVRGIGNFGGFQFQVQDRSGGPPEALAAAVSGVLGEGNQQPGLRGLFTAFTANDPQFLVSIDREKAKALGVPLSDIAATLQVYMGSQHVNDFEFNNRSYRVYVQADRQFRASPRDIKEFYVRSGSGDMIPLDNLVTIREVTAPQTINHFNLFRSAEIIGAAAPGYSSGEAIAAMEETARRVLPQGMTYAWSGLALEEIEAGRTALVIFGLGVLVVFLVLAAQYESWVLPGIVMLAVPVAILGALGAQLLRGFDNDVFCQIGLVLLIGLAARNAILIVEFAEQLRARGEGLVDATIEASRLRLRPILMTSFAFILGLLPLVFASGAGSVARNSLGTAVAGGMLVSTLLNLFLIPVLYLIVEGLRERVLGAKAYEARHETPGGEG
ncbi:MAG TPA: multidrug efflux RND transporter permease subunit [Thermodesulfobacteriota bacterium]